MVALGYAAQRSALAKAIGLGVTGPGLTASGGAAVCGSPTAHAGIHLISCSHPGMKPRLRLPCSEFFNKLKNL